MRAIDADDLKTAFPACDNSKPVLIASVRATINHMPTIEPQRKKGKWIDYTEDGYVECPFCHSATNCDGNKDELHFCFSCGADMTGGEG